MKKVSLFVLASACLAILPVIAQETPGTPAAAPATPPAAPVAAPVAALAPSAPAAAGELATEEQRIVYAIGLQVGNSLKGSGITIDKALFMRAMDDAMSGVQPLMTQDDVREAMGAFEGTLMKKRMQHLEEEGAKNEAEGKKFLEENAKKEGVRVLESGLQYKVLQEGTGRSPKETDTVRISYRCRLTSGEVVDATGDGEAMELSLASAGRVCKGWQQALPLMREGTKWEVTTPSDLGLGKSGKGKIGPNTVLVFDLELVSIVDASSSTEVVIPESAAPDAK